ncbi:MAG: alkaline phosphatase family protein, partial [Pseudohongiellaceae bacterium]
MIRRLLFAILLFCTTLPVWAQPLLSTDQPPRLVLAVVVDQLRYDYLTRFESDLDAGLKRLLSEGAVFTNAHYEAAPTMTAVGHSTFLTGATPSVSGIAGNGWYDRKEARSVQSITDSSMTPLGGGSGASPRRMLVSTVGDELKIAGKGGKVFGVSLKDRGAILPAGHMADGAFWMNNENGHFVSSNWYFPELPAWVSAFNAANPSDQYAGAQWLDLQLPAEAGQDLYRALDATPFSDQLVLDFSLELLRQEQLGTSGQTDLLAVSFSAMDYVGHGTGPDTLRMRDMVLSIDTKLGR